MLLSMAVLTRLSKKLYVEHDLSLCSIILTLTLTLCVRYVLRRSNKLAFVRVRSNKIFPVRVHLYEFNKKHKFSEFSHFSESPLE